MSVRKFNLISTSQLCDNAFDVSFDLNGINISKDNNTFITRIRKNNTYAIELKRSKNVALSVLHLKPMMLGCSIRGLGSLFQSRRLLN